MNIFRQCLYRNLKHKSYLYYIFLYTWYSSYFTWSSQMLGWTWRLRVRYFLGLVVCNVADIWMPCTYAKIKEEAQKTETHILSPLGLTSTFPHQQCPPGSTCLCLLHLPVGPPHIGHSTGPHVAHLYTSLSCVQASTAHCLPNLQTPGVLITKKAKN